MHAKSCETSEVYDAKPTTDIPRRGWLTPEEPEWVQAWQTFPDPLLTHPVSGECREYVGSAQEAADGWRHVLRHRQLPTTQQRTYWRVPATPGWAPQLSQQVETTADHERHERGSRRAMS